MLHDNKNCCIFAPHLSKMQNISALGGANIIKMWQTIIISIGILLFCLVFLAIKILIKKDGRFPNTHVSNNKAMRERGIHCVQTQDWEERNHKGLYD